MFNINLTMSEGIQYNGFDVLISVQSDCGDYCGTPYINYDIYYGPIYLLTVSNIKTAFQTIDRIHKPDTNINEYNYHHYMKIYDVITINDFTMKSHNTVTEYQYKDVMTQTLYTIRYYNVKIPYATITINRVSSAKIDTRFNDIDECIEYINSEK